MFDWGYGLMVCRGGYAEFEFNFKISLRSLNDLKLILNLNSNFAYPYRTLIGGFGRTPDSGAMTSVCKGRYAEFEFKFKISFRSLHR